MDIDVAMNVMGKSVIYEKPDKGRIDSAQACKFCTFDKASCNDVRFHKICESLDVFSGTYGYFREVSLTNPK